MDRTRESAFSKFKKDNERKTVSWLKYKYSVLSEEKIEGIIQKSYDVLYMSIKNWEIIEDYYPYFLKTCKNFSLKAINEQRTHPVLRYDESVFELDDEEQKQNFVTETQITTVIRATEENESDTAEKKELVHRTLDKMATRCKELLWSYYADELSWSTIAGLYGLKNANSAKTAASRCRQTFKEKYTQIKSIYG